MIVKLHLDKNTGKAYFNNIIPWNCKVDIIDFTDTLIFLKTSGFSSYTDRISGVGYVQASYHVFKIYKIVNYEDCIIFDVDFDICQEIPVKNTNQRIIDLFKDKEIDKKADPLAGLSPRDREIIENNIREQKQLIDRIEERLK